MVKPVPERLMLLAALLGQPEADAKDVLDGMAKAAPWLEDAVAELRQTGLGDWQAEHCRLFVTGYPKTVCPPFESAYRHGVMNGPVVEELGDFFERLSLEVDDAPLDYLGTLLQTAAWLAGTGNQKLLDKFWKDHLHSWVPKFAADLQAGAEMKIYKELGAQLALLFQHD